jgi:hypothetical protein
MRLFGLTKRRKRLEGGRKLILQFLEADRRFRRAGVAQLIERFLAKEEARGLSPLTRTIRNFEPV